MKQLRRVQITPWTRVFAGNKWQLAALRPQLLKKKYVGITAWAVRAAILPGGADGVYAAINRLVRELLATWLYRSNGPQGRDPAWLPSAGCYLFARTVRNTAWMYSLVSTVQTRRKMRHVLSAIAVLLALATTASAEEATTGPANADSATEDCSKQVWPNFSASCLRNADRALNVRLITASRR